MTQTRTVKTGTWYRLLQEVPGLQTILLAAEGYATNHGAGLCRYRVWHVLFERWVAERFGLAAERHAVSVEDLLEDGAAYQLTRAEYDVVRETIMGALPPCPSDCDCKDRDRRLGGSGLSRLLRDLDESSEHAGGEPPGAVSAKVEP